MPPHPFPTLKYLALERCGKSVAEILHSSYEEEEKLKKILQVCESLHGMPHALANDITAMLLRCLEQKWNKVNLPEEINLIIAVSLIHPKVEAIDITSCPDIGKYMMGALIHLSDLVQYFPNFNTLKNVDIMKTLKKFVCRDSCEDKTLTALISCTSIESIDVEGSSDVKDANLHTLIALRQLNYLNVSRTSISQDDLSKLLEALCNGQDVSPLCEFYCSDISTEQLHLLIQCRRLTHIGIRIKNCDISDLKNLEYLKAVRLEDCGFGKLRATFINIGGKLCDIHLKKIEEVDINFIVETFPKLERLALMDCTYVSVAPSWRHKDPPSFQSLQVLKIFKIESQELSYLIYTCRNLIEFEMDTILKVSSDTISDLCSLKKIEKFVLKARNSSVLSRPDVEDLFRSWKHLKVYENFGQAREDLNIESLKEEIRQTYPTVEVTITATKLPYVMFA
jgi:hypothetical protein